MSVSNRSWIVVLFFAIALAGIPGFLFHNLLQNIVVDEQQRMHTWARATEAFSSDDPNSAKEVVLHILTSNKTIPIILTDDSDEVISFSNITINSSDTTAFLQRKLEAFKGNYPPIVIDLGDDYMQYLYYSDSKTLKSLMRMPWVQLTLLILYLILVLAVLARIKKIESDRIWKGLSRETAHQLGTPISSLMAWIELLKAQGVSESVTSEMLKDTDRLNLIAHRFQKIGSTPELETVEVRTALEQAIGYMISRISQQVTVHQSYDFDQPVGVNVSLPLFNWVVENLIKNSVDAMDGQGFINVKVTVAGGRCCIDIQDTGKGMDQHTARRLFDPGYTTKKRGWGLGLSLCRRIMQNNFHGSIHLQSTEIGRGTTFRLRLPIVPYDA